MKKFIEDLKNINETGMNDDLLLRIKILLEQAEKARKEGKEEFAEYLDYQARQLRNNNNINIVKDYLREIQKIDKFSSIPVKIDDNTKIKFKNIATKDLKIKQGELFGILIKYFVDTYCKENPDSEVCKDKNENN